MGTAIEMQICEKCGDHKPLADFRGRVHTFGWCKECRIIDSKEAKRAQDRRIKRMQYTPEAGRVRHEAYKKAHPERLQWRSEQTIERTAAKMAVEGIEYAKKLSRRRCKELGYTRGQINKVVATLDQWGQMFRVEEESKT